MNIFHNFYTDLIEAFENVNISVDTKRFCSQPLLSYKEYLKYEKSADEILLLLDNHLSILQAMFNKYKIDYYSCACLHSNDLEHLNRLEESILSQFEVFIKKYPKLFTSLPVIYKNEIVCSALKIGAKLIKKLAEPDPFNNLKFCVSCQVPSNTPFFPAAYHKNSEKPAFSIALEMADEVCNVFENAKNFNEAKINLKKKFEEIYVSLITISEKIARKYKIEFEGIDFSPAPYPTKDKSIGTAIEQLGIEYFSAYGTLTGVALITNAIPKKNKVIGFSGFMQPVFEDYTLAKRLSESKYNLDSLLLYSTICGTGIDCIPLPGDISERELFYILLDLSTLSIIHKKPLTARLMPIPGKKAGEDIQFENFEYFAPSKVMEIRRLVKPNKKDLFDQKVSKINFL
jgi:uncharacterized protein (UPF0210 family)